MLRRWLHGKPDWETPVAEVDLRVGGMIRIVMRNPSDGRLTSQERGWHVCYDNLERLLGR